MVQIDILGYLYDDKSSFLKGPAKAPPLIRKAYHSNSANYYTENGIDLSLQSISELGDLSFSSYEEIFTATCSHVSKDRVLVSIGGDHSITYPIVKAHNQVKERFDILHFDAHGDLYDEFEGDRYSHACPFARIMEERLADKLYQVGIRTYTEHQRDQVKRFNVFSMEMKDFSLDNFPVLQRPVYISVDLDVLDPAFAPGISHHEPGGISVRQLINCLQLIHVPVVGADLVEYNPERDVNGVTSMVGAKILKELLDAVIRNH